MVDRPAALRHDCRGAAGQFFRLTASPVTSSEPIGTSESRNARAASFRRERAPAESAADRVQTPPFAADPIA
ncbi:hypothetical protein C7S16_5947 [Burkholderia thailandensis]|uniref:Uncharacterized protein n=1 Tax=Burkholderia thailandensis TaxID=57975 RepID=A0AAW9CQX0_BURTH|nr:hypothetical protein [Burkholderia thailandensis]MDW9253420.1 hypothetical protein [Burkholderia thailandensis]